ncbi:hypothetical protein MKS88_005704 [Plasmodium brasilianum]|uniref:TOG domain-containing protein n=2 Tax=Plasmodium (Plasmodium) TaxID=418103 RepID=A0A1A8WDJ3_PLAMA|nr:conserved Plasmodium protein, unknown function [Plasmodium malariae]KAI4835021.1 hypothetical protein MKS88_005704 [Plasmodium brasilianum]SBS91074.1 hypothetical protein, conserved [Plasmodium malariae]SCP03596.1 conserved Plasmodium protein, unknown function [Plasmodium malariae]
MLSKDRDNSKLKYNILSISSNDKDHDVTYLLKNTDVEIYKPWLSEQNCIYPQEFILQIKPAKIKYLEFLSHEYAISRKIEIYISNNNKDFLKAGFFRFNDNASTNYCAKELKYVYLPCSMKCTFVKLRLHSPYHNYLNVHSQIGLYYINIIPEDISLNITSEANTFLKLTSSANKKNKNYNDIKVNNKKALLRKREVTTYSSNLTDNNAAQHFTEEVRLESFKRSYSKCDINKISSLYETLENKIKCFEKIKGECVAKEEFNTANELKKIVNIFISLKNVITFIKGKKKKYVREENYGKAKRLKEKEIKIKIIIKNIEELNIINNCSRKWYYEWLVLYYKELEYYEKEINKIMSNENIKKNSALFDNHKNDNDNDVDLNNILLFICSDNEKKREMGFDLAYKPFEDRDKKYKNFWLNNLESLCLIIKRGISDPYYNIFIKSVVTLEKMLNKFQDYFLKLDNRHDDHFNDKNIKYLKHIISSLLKRLDDSNLDVVDICIKTIMMMLHNNFTSFKNVFSIILSMLFYFFSADVTSEINEKIIVSLMSFYYSLINKYYTSVKNDINLKKVLEIISLFLEVDLESIKQTSLDFFVNIYNTVENRNELFEEFLLNVSYDTKNLIINRVNQEEKENTKTLKNANDEKNENENEKPKKHCLFINNDELLKKNSYLNNNYLNIKEFTSFEHNTEKIDENENVSIGVIRNNNTENCTALNINMKDNRLVDKNSKLTFVENSHLKKEKCPSEIQELQDNSTTENKEYEKVQMVAVNKMKATETDLITISSLHKKEAPINEQVKRESSTKHEEKLTNKSEDVEDSTKIDDEYDETNVPSFTCKYCFKYDEAFTEIGLEKHWIKKCPMLCTCPNCFLIVELVVIYDHFLSECSHNHMYTPCEYCNKIVKKNLLDSHVMNECNGKKTEYLSCYYCSLCIESFDIDIWRAHFLSCSKNPRLQ